MKYLITSILSIIATSAVFLYFKYRKKETKKINFGETIEKTIPIDDNIKRDNLTKYGTECSPPD